MSACVRESYKTDKELCECVRVECREIFKNIMSETFLQRAVIAFFGLIPTKGDSLLRKLERRINS